MKVKKKNKKNRWAQMCWNLNNIGEFLVKLQTMRQSREKKLLAIDKEDRWSSTENIKEKGKT